MKSMEELKTILPDAKEALKTTKLFEELLEERKKTERPRLLYLEKCLQLIKQEIAVVSVQGRSSFTFNPPEIDELLSQFSIWMELQQLLHDSGYSAELYPGVNEIVISWKSRF